MRFFFQTFSCHDVCIRLYHTGLTLMLGCPSQVRIYAKKNQNQKYLKKMQPSWKKYHNQNINFKMVFKPKILVELFCLDKFKIRLKKRKFFFRTLHNIL